MDKKKIILEDEEAKPLVLAATGKPYFIMVQTKKGYLLHVEKGFDIGHILQWLRDYAADNPDFRQVLADFVIDVAVNDIDV